MLDFLYHLALFSNGEDGRDKPEKSAHVERRAPMFVISETI